MTSTEQSPQIFMLLLTISNSLLVEDFNLTIVLADLLLAMMARIAHLPMMVVTAVLPMIVAPVMILVAALSIMPLPPVSLSQVVIFSTLSLAVTPTLSRVNSTPWMSASIIPPHLRNSITIIGLRALSRTTDSGATLMHPNFAEILTSAWMLPLSTPEPAP